MQLLKLKRQSSGAQNGTIYFFFFFFGFLEP